MGGIGDLIQSVVETATSFVQNVWDDVVAPIAESAMGILGIDGETIVSAEKVSVLVHGNNTDDAYRAAVTRAVLKKIDNNTDFFPNYMTEVFTPKAQIRAFFNYVDRGLYFHGAPTFQVQGKNADLAVIKTALDTEKGGLNTILTTRSTFPTDEIYHKDKLQAAPYFYIPWTNTLTKNDQYGVSRSDWNWNEVTYNNGNGTYNIIVSRITNEALFWIRGPAHIVEGDTAQFIIKCNRTVPVGESVTINFSYSGTAVDGTDFTSVASAVMVASTNEVTVNIVTLESTPMYFTMIDGNPIFHHIIDHGVFFTMHDGNPVFYDIPRYNPFFKIKIDSITNTNAAFDLVGIHTRESVSCTIIDDEGIILTASDVLTSETGTVAVIFTLEQSTTAPFTVDYTFTDITATGTTGGVGGDYDNTTGTLNFTGLVGDTATVNVPVTVDIVDDDFEQFYVGLTNCSDPRVDISQKAIVTIVDGTDDPPATTGYVEEIIPQPAHAPVRSLVTTYYNDLNTSSEWFYWVYDFADATYAGLEPTMSVITGLEMIPTAILRKNKVSINTTPMSNEYLTTRILLQRLGLKVDDVISSIESSPDIDVIETAYLNFSFSPATNYSLISKALWLTWFEIAVTNNLQVVSNTGEFTSTFNLGDIDNAIVWNVHTYTTGLTGVKAAVGEYAHTVVDTSYQDCKPAPNPDHNDICTIVHGSEFYVYKQTDVNTYDQIQVDNLNSFSGINYGTYHQMGLARILDDNGNPDPNFTFPMSWFVFNKFTGKEILNLYQYCFYIDIYAFQVTELAWYETAAFTNLFQFALTAISIVTLGADGGTFAAFATQLVVSYAIGELLIFIADITGSKVLAAVVAITVAVYIKKGKFDFSQFNDVTDLIDLGTDFTNNMQFLNDQEAADLNKQIANETKKVKDKMKADAENRRKNPVKLPSPEFIASLHQGTDQREVAIQGQYQYDKTFEIPVGSAYYDPKLTLSTSN